MSQLADLIQYVFDTLMKYNPVMRFYQYSAARPLPIEPFLHQVEVLSRCMLRDPIRILIGDEIGLGKTITAIVLGKYLQGAGRVRRVLVLVPRILVQQWIDELSYWVDAGGLYQVERGTVEELARRGFPEGWYVASMDLFARNRNVREALLKVDWDLIIVDEAHRISPQTAKMRWRYIGEELIAEHPERNVILLTATPHKGFPDDYIARLRILDPALIARKSELDTEKFYKRTWDALVFRRMKSDVNKIYEGREVFKPAYLRAVLIKPSRLEAEFYSGVEQFLLKLLRKYSEASGERLKAVKLLATVLAKRTYSSPAAAYSTLVFMTTKRAELLRGVDPKEAERRANILRKYVTKHLFGDYTAEDIAFTEEIQKELKKIMGPQEPSLDNVLNVFATYASILLDRDDTKELEKLKDLAVKISKSEDTKIAKLKELIKFHLGEGSKIVVFTEYADTAYYIAERIKDVVGDSLKVFTGAEAGSREGREDVVRNFIKGDRYRVLISTDVLSEGLNLQAANVLINYDLPWTPLKLEQRIGRVWRLGQKRECFIYMLVTGSTDSATGASRVVSKLYTKLLNMERAQLGNINNVLGKDVEVYDKDLSKAIGEVPPLIVGSVAKAKRKTVSESYIILASLSDNSFEKFVKWYIESVKNLERRIRDRHVDPVLKPEAKNLVLDTVCLSSQEELKSILLELLQHLVPKEVVSGSFSQKPLNEMSVKELLAILQRFSKGRGTPRRPVSITVWGCGAKSRIYIVKAVLSVNRTVRYEEILGVEEHSNRVLCGVELLKRILPVVGNPYRVDDNVESRSEDIVWIRSTVDNYFSDRLLVKGLEDVERYVKYLNEQGLRDAGRFSMATPSDVDIGVELVGVLNLVPEYEGDMIERLVGEYDERKAEIEDEAISILREKLQQKFFVQDLHKKGAPFDLILVEREEKEHREHRIVEVKSWRNIDFAIYTDNEKEFGEEFESIGGNYWLYVVDMRETPIRILGFRKPFTTNALRLVWEINKNGRRYYLYRIIREPDEML